MKYPVLIRCAGCVLLLAGTAHAADTVETWEAGAVDVDAYVGVDGFGGPRAEREAYVDFMLGYGVVERVSVYAGTTQGFDSALQRAAGEYYWGSFATVLDSPHFDLDVFAAFLSSGEDGSELVLTPALELNWDADADQRVAGAYLRAGVPRRMRAPLEAKPSPVLEVEVGTYVTLAPGHMLFLEHDLTWSTAASRARAPDHGSVALGYNVVLSETVELINELHLDTANATTEPRGGAMTGVILTLPTGE